MRLRPEGPLSQPLTVYQALAQQPLSVYQALVQNVPGYAKNEQLYEIAVTFATVIRQVDSSLIDEWERLRNPAAKPEERYKALAGLKQPGKNWHQGATPGGLYAFASADGLRWRKMRDVPVITQGAFDSLNLAIWDGERGRYACYSRIFANKVRAVQASHSADFLSWSAGVPNTYAADVPWEHFYTSATLPCPGAEHILVAFPMRFEPARRGDTPIAHVVEVPIRFRLKN